MELLLLDEGGRFILLALAFAGFLLQWDNLVESILEARKGGDNDSNEPSPPPTGT